MEKNGDLHPVGHRGKGNIVGELALLTGEPQPAHVEAQTDATLWVLPRRAFEDLSKEDPDLLDFLTELTADRLDSRRPVADHQIEKYTATEIIGRGGYSIVYRGVHTGLDLPVAIKMMRHDMAADPDFLAGFRNEGKTIAALDHENIVRVYEIEERFRTVFIIMEHVRGESLQSLLQRLKRLPPRLIVSFLLQICAGLDYVHGRGIVHRDIKPDNIIVGPDDLIKILDFGLACPPGTDDCQIGTVFYLAPEQITGDRIDPRTDIYSLGVAAYEMATGTRPFPGASPAELQRLHTQKDIPDPAKLVPNLPRGLRWFILKACRRDPAQRYQTAAEALSALYPVADGFGIDARFTGPKTQKMTGMFLIYDARQQGALNRLLAEFSEKAGEIGAVVKVAEAGDVKKNGKLKSLTSGLEAFTLHSQFENTNNT